MSTRLKNKNSLKELLKSYGFNTRALIALHANATTALEDGQYTELLGRVSPDMLRVRSKDIYPVLKKLNIYHLSILNMTPEETVYKCTLSDGSMFESHRSKEDDNKLGMDEFDSFQAALIDLINQSKGTGEYSYVE
jgi:hypothetical protein